MPFPFAPHNQATSSPRGGSPLTKIQHPSSEQEAYAEFKKECQENIQKLPTFVSLITTATFTYIPGTVAEYKNFKHDTMYAQITYQRKATVKENKIMKSFTDKCIIRDEKFWQDINAIN
jgi:hypothetical protein